MKKIMLFAAACAALAACTKDIDTTSPEVGDGSAFVKGQKVTLTVSAGEQTKVSSELVTSGENKDEVNFKWETGDEILVTVEGKGSAKFTLSSGAGDATATFTGTMPGSGTTFSVQYPAVDPVLTTQTYSATEAIPHDVMKFTATDCPLADSFTLTPQNAALRLNLYGSTAIGSIEVKTNEGTPKTYTLDCMDSGKTGTEPGKTDKPKPFFIVVPAGTYGFTVSVKDVNGTELYSVSTTAGQDKTFEANKILSMKPLGYPGTDAQPIAITTGSPATTTVWAPVNCGYDATHTYGLLYQWGRKYGQAYEDNTIEPSEMKKSDDTEQNKGKFGQYNDKNKNWFSGDVDNTLWNGNPKGTNDPCPEGWRVPTYVELNALYGENFNGEMKNVGGQSGIYFNGTTGASEGVFLPAAGYRYYKDGAVSTTRDSYGNYWSSGPAYDRANTLKIDSNTAFDQAVRANGYSVRCVQQ